MRKDHPRQGKHNALQRLAYFSMPIVGIMAIVTGIAIWKPVQLSPLTNLLGGYVWARYWHFCGDAAARRADVRPHLHGVHGRPVLDSVDDHRASTAKICRPKRATLARSSICCRAPHDAPMSRLSSSLAHARSARSRHPAERLGIDRRRFLAASGGALGALFLAACDSQGPKSAQTMLKFAEREERGASSARCSVTRRWTFRGECKAAGQSVSVVLRLEHSAGMGRGHARRVAARGWRNGAASRCSSRSPISRSLPRTGYELDHFCVEGWTAVAMRTGVRLSDLARLAGADPGAHYVDFQSFDDDYHESWDIESAMHPQTLIVYAQDGRYFNAAWGAPARVYSPVKLGYKNTKYLTQDHVHARAQRWLLERSRLRVVRRRMTAELSDARQPWRALHPERARDLTDARLQLHHAAQIVSAMGISYLPKQSDDSHTNLGWIESISALASHPIRGSSSIQLAVRPHPFALLLLDNGETSASFALDGRTVADAAAWVQDGISKRGLDASAFTLAKHYTIPSHPVGESAPFDASAPQAFDELSAWFSDSAQMLEPIVAPNPNAAPVRCWPHHFDIATILEVALGKTVGVGMEPGDVYYDQPYFYVNMYPFPAAAPTSTLPGGGTWHSHEWIGAVLPGSRLGRDGQREQVAAFLDAAISEGRRTLLR